MPKRAEQFFYLLLVTETGVICAQGNFHQTRITQFRRNGRARHSCARRNMQHRRRAEDCSPYRQLSDLDGSLSVQFRELAPEFAFTFSQFFWDVDLNDNIEVTAFP